MKKLIAAILTFAVAFTAFCIPASAVSYKVKTVRSYENGYTIVNLLPSSGTVYYTTNGTKATRNSNKYKAGTAIKFTKPSTLNVAVYSGGKAVKRYAFKIAVKLKAPSIKFTKKSDGKYTATITAPKGATVYYTTNGKSPSKYGKKLSGNSITVKSGTTVRAIAVKKGWKNSSVLKKTAPKKVAADPDNSSVQDEKEDIIPSPSFEEEVLRLVNLERTKRGLSRLTTSTKLSNAAKERSEELVEFYSHSRPDSRLYSSIFDKYSITYTKSSESIIGGFDYSTPESVVNYWMNSPTDRSNILNPDFKKIGAGYTYKYEGLANHWVLLFTD